MRDYPMAGLTGKAVSLCRSVAALRIGLYSANAGFFLVLAVFPALLLLLGLVRVAGLEVKDLTALLEGFLPEALLPAAEALILQTYDNSSGVLLGISALTALWSAGKGVYGLVQGLNAVYGVTESRNYFHRRVIATVYTFLLLLLLVLTLALDVFWSGLAAFAGRALPFLGLLRRAVDLRFFLLLGIQTVFFCAMFRFLPDRRSGIGSCLPGALLASAGWRLFSGLYSVYAEHFARLTNVFGSVYAAALSMLWLYCCVAIFLTGGAVNRFLEKRSGK